MMFRVYFLFLCLPSLVYGLKIVKTGKKAANNDESFKALKSLHEELDDDHDGQVNEAESADFMKEKKMTDLTGKQQKMFDHDEDHLITVDELWIKWSRSEVYKWSVEEVVYWLKYTVALPEYAHIFRKNKVNGKIIPRLATPQDSYLQKALKITNQHHRRKIYLRASDLILFGVPSDFKHLQSDKSFLAIKAVHTHLDDDKDGSIDADESQEYFDEELEAPTASKRHLSLHTHDDQISVDELWESWQESEVYRWTTDQVVEWLKTVVGLPQYEQKFREKKINGKCIPRIATDKSSFLQTELGVKNPKHRRKIYLRASDIILFGSPEVSSSRFNDTVVAVIVIISTLLCCYTVREKRITRLQIENMSKDMQSLQQAEEELKTLQETLAEAEQRSLANGVDGDRERELLEEIEHAKKEAERLHKERNKSQEEKIKLTLVEQELSEVRLALAKAEVEMKSYMGRTPQALQQWLQQTYQLESQYFQMQKTLAMGQMTEAKDAVDKVSKARRSMFGSLRLAHGQTIDMVDQKIINAKGGLAEVTRMLQERRHRWSEIERLCNFSVVTDGLYAPMMKANRKSSLQQALVEVTNLTLSTPVGEVITEEEEEDEDIHIESQNRRKISNTVTKKPSSRENSFDSETGSSSNHSQPNSLASQNSSQDMNGTSEVYIQQESHRRKFNDTSSVASAPVHRSESAKFDNHTERKIHRVNTEPIGISKQALVNSLNGKAYIDSGSEPNLNNKVFSISSSQLGQRSPSNRSLNDSSDGENYSESGNVSDDSIYSSVSSASKKKKKGIKSRAIAKIFHRKQKVER